MRINNILLLVFFALFVLEGGYKEKWERLKANYTFALPLFALFALAIVAALNHPEKDIFRYLERYWSFVAIPIVVIASKEYQGKASYHLFRGLLWGCVATLLICYGNVIYEMVSKSEPLHYFLRHRHLNHQFTEIADTHPAYLGVFMVVSSAYLFFKSSLKKGIKITLLVFLCFGFIQLASRMALVSFGVVTLVFLITKIRTHWKQIGIGFGVAILCSVLLYFSASEFLRERLISKERIGNDQRFSRNIVSWELFKEHPVLGVGFGRKDALRETKYCKYGFQVAAENRYNAHNQYLEYLSVNGLVGGLTFILVMGYLLYFSWKQRSVFFFLLFLSFFLANSTESMLVRIKGIEFFAISVSLLATSTMIKNDNEYIDHS